jgi:hypothetical protein
MGYGPMGHFATNQMHQPIQPMYGSNTMINPNFNININYQSQ